MKLEVRCRRMQQRGNTVATKDGKILTVLHCMPKVGEHRDTGSVH